jgi:hypothetical protein
MVVQRDLLAAELHGEGSTSAVLDELTQVFRRLPDYLGVLTAANSAAVPPPVLRNENDLQILLHALLRLLYDDVRREDYVPQQAGSNSRVDFTLRGAGVIVEAKMTRQGLADRRLGEELAIDWERYRRHPDCRAIIGIVYDPARHVQNPTALEHDLQGDGEPATRVVVVR